MGDSVQVQLHYITLKIF